MSRHRANHQQQALQRRVRRGNHRPTCSVAVWAASRSRRFVTSSSNCCRNTSGLVGGAAAPRPRGGCALMNLSAHACTPKAKPSGWRRNLGTAACASPQEGQGHAWCVRGRLLLPAQSHQLVIALHQVIAAQTQHVVSFAGRVATARTRDACARHSQLEENGLKGLVLPCHQPRVNQMQLRCQCF